MKTYLCSGHMYIEVRDSSAVDDADKKCFGADGNLTTEWLSALLEIYKDSCAEADSVEDVIGPQPKNGPDVGPGSGHADKIAQVDQVALLVPVLTDEPMEVAAVISNPSTVACDSPAYSTDKPATEKELAPTIQTPHSAMQLLEIWQGLGKEMTAAIEQAKASKEADQQEKQKNDLHPGNSEKASSEYKEQENIKNDEQAESQREDSRDNYPKEGDNQESEEYEQLRFILFEIELAWKLAEIILYGSAEFASIGSFFAVEDDSGKQKNVQNVEEEEERETSTEMRDTTQHPADMKDVENAETGE
jgi:hypothetical protein